MQIDRDRNVIRSLFLALALATLASGAQGAQRTFVASYGSDSNACSLTAPCRSFGAAMTHTDPQGEVIVLDSAGYGRVTIAQSMSIVSPPGVYAGISVFTGENGVDIDGAGIVVKLRGLTINGQGGLFGISFVQGARLYVERCVVSGLASRGINLQTGETFVTDSTIIENGSGIRANSPLKLAVDRTRIQSSVADGIYATNGPTVVVSQSVLTANATAVQLISDDGVNPTFATVTDSTLTDNTSGIDINAGGAASVARVHAARNTISGNSTYGVHVSASVATLTASIVDNVIVRNGWGVTATGAGVNATIAGNTVSENSLAGIRQLNSALLRTRANNIAQDNNPPDVSGTLTFVSGD